ncbi:Uncharacterised protein [Nocardia otitidiscaviarum]|uniref:Uncharacterized protein n=1 Tax=Nocardia otitidiscaviarum TaxID=1823 RepID=A0A379JLS0_9NOCA|nr:Uncharacterised protein [Nocardia otitidiscaviarum]
MLSRLSARYASIGIASTTRSVDRSSAHTRATVRDGHLSVQLKATRRLVSVSASETGVMT